MKIFLLLFKIYSEINLNMFFVCFRSEERMANSANADSLYHQRPKNNVFDNSTPNRPASFNVLTGLTNNDSGIGNHYSNTHNSERKNSFVLEHDLNSHNPERKNSFVLEHGSNSHNPNSFAVKHCSNKLDGDNFHHQNQRARSCDRSNKASAVDTISKNDLISKVQHLHLKNNVEDSETQSEEDHKWDGFGSQKNLASGGSENKENLIAGTKPLYIHFLLLNPYAATRIYVCFIFIENV